MTVGRSDGQSTGIGVVSAGLSAVYDALGVGSDEGDEEEADDVTFIDETITDTDDEQTDDSAEDPFSELDPDALSLPDETEADPSEEPVAGDSDGVSWADAADSDELAWSGDDDDDWGFDESDTEASFSFGGESEPETVRVENDTFGLDDVRCDDPDEHYETAHDEFKAVSEELEFSGTVDDLELDALTLGDSADIDELDDDMETVDLDDLTREESAGPTHDDPDWDPGFDGDGPDMDGFNFGVEETDGWS
ncbi:hypothetical protein [Haloarchaeobius iranensis]|uniref:Uncharacterized protein n=1 Tax=Haloarchaeobius iranensis TaxID=996166 RepID=A0A1G9SEF8_9EURY|nr:hypothetical protein [Haloarchaeobius iranensis]SDM33771.1 hypothetical protein SAMN05192554_101127 [Haloarchaeobius iranensis]